MFTFERYFKQFISKKVTADLDKMDGISQDFDWDAYDEDDFPGAGHIYLDTHKSDENPAWGIRIGLWFEVDENVCIADIRLTADAFGEDGLGDCDPEEEHSQRDIDIATTFLKEITS